MHAAARLPSPHDSPAAWAAVRRRRRRKARRAASRSRRRAWGATYAGTALAVGVGASGLLARVSSPVVAWWPQIAAGALPVLGPAAGPAALAVGVAAARGRRFGGGVCAVALASLFAGWALRTSSPPAAAAGAGSETLDVLTLNVGASDRRIGQIVAYVEQTRPDVVLLQEAAVSWGPYSPVAARIALVDGYTVLTDTTRGRIGPSRQVTVTRLPVVSFEAGFLGESQPRAGVFSRAVLRWDGREIAVYNAHLRPFHPEVPWSWTRMVDPDVWAETPARLDAFFAEQAVEAEALQRRVGDESRPVIVAGDFNATPDMWSRSRLGASLRETTGRWWPAATRPDRVPLVNVDGVLVGAGWGVVRAGVAPAGFSDHRGVAASLRFVP